MFARASTYELPEDRRDEATLLFREALDGISRSEGFEGGYFLVSCDGDRAMTMTFWDSRASMESSRVTASRLRSDAARQADGGVVSVDEFEVTVDASRSAPDTLPAWEG